MVVDRIRRHQGAQSGVAFNPVRNQPNQTKTTQLFFFYSNIIIPLIKRKKSSTCFIVKLKKIVFKIKKLKIFKSSFRATHVVVEFLNFCICRIEASSFIKNPFVLLTKSCVKTELGTNSKRDPDSSSSCWSLKNSSRFSSQYKGSAMFTSFGTTRKRDSYKRTSLTRGR